MQHARFPEPYSLHAIVLLGLACLGTAAMRRPPPTARIKLKGDDKMQFDLKTATGVGRMPDITIELTHTGKLAEGR